jgi:signal peptidase I
LPQTQSIPVQSVLGTATNRLKLSASQYLPLGDNTLYSLDGRYFGPVERQHIVGPAFAVYWPFSKRWGFVD